MMAACLLKKYSFLPNHKSYTLGYKVLNGHFKEIVSE